MHKGKLTAEQQDITYRNLENKLRVLKNMIDRYFIMKNNQIFVATILSTMGITED